MSYDAQLFKDLSSSKICFLTFSYSSLVWHDNVGTHISGYFIRCTFLCERERESKTAVEPRYPICRLNVIEDFVPVEIPSSLYSSKKEKEKELVVTCEVHTTHCFTGVTSVQSSATKYGANWDDGT